MYTAVEDYVGLSPIGPWSHRGLRKEFAAKMNSSGVNRQIARSLGNQLAEGLNGRLAADYRRKPATQSDVRKTLTSAETLLNWIEKEMNP